MQIRAGHGDFAMLVACRDRSRYVVRFPQIQQDIVAANVFTTGPADKLVVVADRIADGRGRRRPAPAGTGACRRCAWTTATTLFEGVRSHCGYEEALPEAVLGYFDIAVELP